MKKFIIAALSALTICAVCFGGCLNGRDGVDGLNGKDLSIYDIYEAYNEAIVEEGGEALSFLEFLNTYLSFDYTDSELNDALSLKASINRCLLSSVSIIARFTYTSTVLRKDYDSLAAGSGVIVDVDTDMGNAYIITNCHVLYDSDANSTYSDYIRVFPYGQEDYDYEEDGYSIDIIGGMEAEIVAASPAYDLALLKIQANDEIKNSSLRACEFADDETDVGETVFAIGNPGNYGLSVTYGIVSTDTDEIGVTFDSASDLNLYYRVLRTDTAINTGNSGGGLYNSEGKVIGIVNAKAGADGYENMGYALPASMVKRVMQSMIDSDDNDSSTIQEGIDRFILDVLLDYDSLPAYTDDGGIVRKREAVYVSSIYNSALAYGKFQEGDLLKHVSIVSSEGDVKEDFDVLRLYYVVDAMISARKNDTVTFTISRSGQELEISFDVTALENRWEDVAVNSGADCLYYI